MSPLPNPNLDYHIPLAAVSMIADYESLRLKAYRCPAGVWTCGWGETKDVTPTTIWTKQDADQRLCDSINLIVSQVLDVCTLHPTDNQLGALVCLVYNIGLGNFEKSSVLKLHNLGKFQAASRAFNLWNKATVDGKLTELPGLTARRAAEQAFYLKPEEEAAPHLMPQAVVAESSLAASPTAVTGGGVAVGGLGVLSSASDAVSPYVQQAKDWAETFNLNPVYVLGGIAAVAGATVLYSRVKQRSEGWV